MGPPVLTVAEVGHAALARVVEALGMSLVQVPCGESIPGSFWGSREAGLRGCSLLVRGDTPVHSALHEAGHFFCMDEARRRYLDTDAGGDVDEECAVCALQVLLADQLPAMGQDRMLADMDTWGYSFRLGSARRWWATDALDALAWLDRHGLPAALSAAAPVTSSTPQHRPLAAAQ